MNVLKWDWCPSPIKVTNTIEKTDYVILLTNIYIYISINVELLEALPHS
jgi:hypothetical protein